VEGLNIKPSLQTKSIKIIANNSTSTDGQIVKDKESASLVKVLVDFSAEDYYTRVTNSLCNKEQSAVIGSFEEQTAVWSRPPKNLET
jgi:dihydrodipicolinate reductase